MSEGEHSPSRDEQAVALGRARRRRFLAEAALGLALPLLAWYSGLVPALAAALGLAPAPGAPGGAWLVGGWVPGAWLAAALLVAVLLVGYRLALLPVDYLAGYCLSRRYGLTTQSPAGWLLDWLKVTALALLFGVVVALLFYGSLAAFGAGWWAAFALLLSLGLVFIAYVAPYLLLPLFYRLRPLERGPLTERIDALFARAHAPRPPIAAIDLSSRTTAANAAVIGLGTSRRVVLGDTLLEQFSLDEIETVVAHELGHNVHADVLRGLAIEVGMIWAGLAVAAALLDPVFRALGWGDWRAPAALPLLAFLAEAAGLLAMPLFNAFSRHVERAADRYALDQTDKPAAFAEAMRKLASQNLIEAEPPRWAEWLLYTHPPVAQRIRMAEGYARA
jgi:STE24 endopeptidase